jgi:hypothetical protein
LSGSDVAISIQCAEASAEINTFSANPELSVAQFTTDVSPASADINSFSANPELSVAQRNAFSANDVAAYDWAGYFGYGPLENLSDYAVDVAAYDWAGYFGYGPLEILNNTDAAPVSAEINTFSANPELSVAQRFAVAAPVSAETKDCFADCYDDY